MIKSVNSGKVSDLRSSEKDAEDNHHSSSAGNFKRNKLLAHFYHYALKNDVTLANMVAMEEFRMYNPYPCCSSFGPPQIAPFKWDDNLGCRACHLNYAMQKQSVHGDSNMEVKVGCESDYEMSISHSMNNSSFLNNFNP